MLEFCRTVSPNLEDYEADGVRFPERSQRSVFVLTFDLILVFYSRRGQHFWTTSSRGRTARLHEELKHGITRAVTPGRFHFPASKLDTLSPYSGPPRLAVLHPLTFHTIASLYDIKPTDFRSSIVSLATPYLSKMHEYKIFVQ